MFGIFGGAGGMGGGSSDFMNNSSNAFGQSQDNSHH